jgi:hypothetical protein
MKPKMDGVIKNVGKGSHDEELPTRFSRDDFTGATQFQRADNYYGKQKRKVDVEMEKLMKETSAFGATPMVGRGY